MSNRLLRYFVLCLVIGLSVFLLQLSTYGGQPSLVKTPILTPPKDVEYFPYTVEGEQSNMWETATARASQLGLTLTSNWVSASQTQAIMEQTPAFIRTQAAATSIAKFQLTSTVLVHNAGGTATSLAVLFPFTATSSPFLYEVRDG